MVRDLISSLFFMLLSVLCQIASEGSELRSWFTEDWRGKRKELVAISTAEGQRRDVPSGVKNDRMVVERASEENERK